MSEKTEKRLTIDLNIELHTKLKQIAAMNKMTMKNVVVKLIKEYVS